MLTTRIYEQFYKFISVVVANAEDISVEIFDMSDRLIISENNVSQSVSKYIIATDGIYLVKVGNSVFKKVKIVR